MKDGRRVMFEVRIEGTGWAYIPESIPDDKVVDYLQAMSTMYAGNKLWDATTEIIHVRRED